MASRKRPDKSQDRVAVPASIASVTAWVDRIYGKRKPKRVVEELIAERRRESRKE
jgi:hypothetical protein